MPNPKNRRRPSLWEWCWQIWQLKKKGTVICPLMTKQPGRFWPELCACDIPDERTSFLAGFGAPRRCAQRGRCLPRTRAPLEASAEVHRRSRT